MRRRVQQVLEPGKKMGTAQICRESIRVLFLHPSHFHSICVFLFYPVPISLFIAHVLVRRFPGLPPSAVRPIHSILEQNGAPTIVLRVLTNSIFSALICIPSSLTFSLLGRAATVRSVTRSYGGAGLTGTRFFVSSELWTQLLHTCFWEFFIVVVLCFLMLSCWVAVLKILNAYVGCSGACCFWGVLGFLGIPFCVGFAHLMVVGNLATVMTVLEGEDCSGLQSLAKAKALVEQRRQTALFMALLSSAGMRLVEGLFELRLSRGMYMWEGSILISMYSFMLVIETIQNVVFYYTSK